MYTHFDGQRSWERERERDTGKCVYLVSSDFLIPDEDDPLTSSYHPSITLAIHARPSLFSAAGAIEKKEKESLHDN